MSLTVKVTDFCRQVHSRPTCQKQVYSTVRFPKVKEKTKQIAKPQMYIVFYVYLRTLGEKTSMQISDL